MNNIVFLNLKDFTSSYLELFHFHLNKSLIQSGSNNLTIDDNNSQESLVQIKFLNQEFKNILSLCEFSEENSLENIFLHQLLDTTSILQKNLDWTFDKFNEKKVLPSFSFLFTAHQIFKNVIMQLSKFESFNPSYVFDFSKYFAFLEPHPFFSIVFENEKISPEKIPVTVRILELSFLNIKNLLESCTISNSSADFEKIYQFIESNIDHYCDLVKDCNQSQAEISALYHDNQSFYKKIGGDLNPYIQKLSPEEHSIQKNQLEKAQKNISLQKKYSL